MSLETVRVVIRISPPSSEEEQQSDRIIELLEENKLIAYHPESKQGLMYQFDSTYDQHVPNVDIFTNSCIDKVRLFLSGYNVCFLSYGPSKTGKTQLFFGTPDELGLVSLTVKEIFNAAISDNKDFRYEIFLQFWEMNNTDIIDLLQPRGKQEQRKFKIHKDPQNKEKAIKNVTIRSLESYEHFESVMKRGTLFSQEVSLQRGIRWHNFLKITVSRTERNRPQHTIQSSAFFVNLKGTDRLGQYGANQNLIKEGASINRSITAFGNTIHNIVGYCRKKFRKGENLPRNITKLRQYLQKDTHSMFGDSKMTLILSDIFVGNYYTTILCSISSSEFHYLETVDALENLRIANHIPVFPEKGIVKNTEIFQVHKEIVKIERNLEKDPLAPGHPPTEQQERLFELRKEFVILCEEEGLSASQVLDDEDEVRSSSRQSSKKSSSIHGFEFGSFPDESDRSKQTFFMPKKKKKKKKKVGSIEMFKELTRKVESQGGGGERNHPSQKKKQKRKKLYQYVYQGSWDQGNKNGFGIIETKRYKYEGFWRRNKKHGRIGVLSIKEQKKVAIKNPKTMLSKKFRKKTVYRRVYKGEWRNGKKHGRGIYYFKNGEMYIGEWENDKKHGSGIMYKLDGSKHTGFYAFDMKNGYGITEYKNGNLFRGYFSKDQKHGPGIYFYRDQNQVYKGEWAEGVPRCGEIGYLEEVLPGNEEPEHVLNRIPLPKCEIDDRVNLINEAVVKTRKSTKGILIKPPKSELFENEEIEGEEIEIIKTSYDEDNNNKIQEFEKEMDFIKDDYERLLFPKGREDYEKTYEERLRKIRLIEERRRRKAGKKLEEEQEEIRRIERSERRRKEEEQEQIEEEEEKYLHDDDDEEGEFDGELEEEGEFTESYIDQQSDYTNTIGDDEQEGERIYDDDDDDNTDASRSLYDGTEGSRSPQYEEHEGERLLYDRVVEEGRREEGEEEEEGEMMYMQGRENDNDADLQDGIYDLNEEEGEGEMYEEEGEGEVFYD